MNTPLYQTFTVVLPLAVLLAVLYRNTQDSEKLIFAFRYSVVVVFFYTLLFWLDNSSVSAVLNNVFGVVVMLFIILVFCVAVGVQYNEQEMPSTDTLVKLGGQLLIVFGIATATALIMKGSSLVSKWADHALRFWIVPMFLFGGTTFVISKGVFEPNEINQRTFFMEMIKTWAGYGLVSQYMYSVAPNRV